MIGTEFITGQGLGNQLFVYVTSRCLALDKGCKFGTASQEKFAMNVHNDRGMYFMDIDLGEKITEEMKKNYKIYNEKEVRLHIGNSIHDMELGCYVTGVDEDLSKVEDNTIVYGNLQDESYFIHHIDEVKEWLKVLPEYDSYEYSSDDLCIINVRGGEYSGRPELFVSRRYYLNAIKKMKEINPNMRFMIVTDDEQAANRILPNIEAHHFDMGKDYVTIKNAHYLIMSNTSFAILPTHTSDTLKYAIAPKYWARHNVSDGYWASEQNIYSLYHYMDKKGQLYTPEECRRELQEYKKRSRKFKKDLEKATGLKKLKQLSYHKFLMIRFWIGRIGLSLRKRLGVVKY